MNKVSDIISATAVDRRTLGSCPAAIRFVPGQRGAQLLINRDSFPRLTPFAQRFVVLHELGHYLLTTDSEEEADTFALLLLAGSERDSLRRSLRTLLELDITPRRFQHLADACLLIDTIQQNH